MPCQMRSCGFGRTKRTIRPKSNGVRDMAELGSQSARDDRPTEQVMTTRLIAAAFAFMLGAAVATAASAQEVLPRPGPPFKGHIERTIKGSVQDFPRETAAPKGAPNVLLILTDDVGFGASSTFGGPVPTPTMDRLAKIGLRYAQFHTCALCSPSRSALLSGRNHHTNGTGLIMEAGTGFPGYNTMMSKGCGT